MDSDRTTAVLLQDFKAEALSAYNPLVKMYVKYEDDRLSMTVCYKLNHGSRN